MRPKKVGFVKSLQFIQDSCGAQDAEGYVTAQHQAVFVFVDSSDISGPNFQSVEENRTLGWSTVDYNYNNCSQLIAQREIPIQNLRH